MKKKNRQLTFGIIGYGRFGQLWAKYLSKHGQVFVFDKKNKITQKTRGIIPSNLALATSADIVFLAVPISEMAKCCRTISPLLPRGTLVVDVCSVKTFPVAIMKKFLPKNQPMLSTHPLFGPDSEKINHGLRGFQIAVCRIAKVSGLEKSLIQIFKKLKLKIIFTSPRKHDRQMATSQALVHFIGRGLAKLKLRPQKISTPDYKSLVRMHQMVGNDTWRLFFDMQNKNPFAGHMRRKLLENLKSLHETAVSNSGNLGELRRDVERVDAAIIQLLGQRLRIVQKIGKLKQNQKLSVVSANRERDIKKMHNRESKRHRVDSKLSGEIFNLIIKHSRAIQNRKP